MPQKKQSPPRKKAKRSRAASPLRQAVTYTRVSSKDQEKEGFSIPAQQKLLQQYALEHDLDIVEEFEDVETAKRAGRTNFSKMLQFLKRRRACRIVLVEKTDRLYRNLKDWVALDEMDLEIHLVKEGAILSDDSRSSEKFIHGIKVLMAKNYIDNLSEETRKGMREKAEQGIYPSQAPMGYRNTVRTDGKRIIEPCPDMGPLVLKLFEEYGTGQHSIATLAKLARSVGLHFRKSTRPLPRSSVHRMLSNPIYIGQFDWNGVRYDGVHDAIVPLELYERVQATLNGRAYNGGKPASRQFAFSGLIRCGHCWPDHERRLIGELHKGKYIYYRCEGCRRAGRAKYINEKVIDEAVVESLKQIRIDEEVLGYVVDALRRSHKDERRDHDESIGRLQEEYEQIQARIDRAYDDRLDGRISADFFERKSRQWREAQARLRRDMGAHEAADQSYLEQGVALLELASNAVRLYKSQESAEKRKLLNFVYSNCIWEDGVLHVEWRQPFEMLAESIAEARTTNGPGGADSGDFENWLRRRDSNPRPGG